MAKPQVVVVIPPEFAASMQQFINQMAQRWRLPVIVGQAAEPYRSRSRLVARRSGTIVVAEGQRKPGICASARNIARDMPFTSEWRDIFIVACIPQAVSLSFFNVVGHRGNA